MSASQYDVVVVGAGCAGLTAAIGLARNGFSVAVIEAAAQVGGSGAIGGVCFAENLVLPDILGADGVASLAWERRLIERGSFATDGRRIAGTIYRDPDAFRHCYIVLRPLFDLHLAQLARRYGVTLREETTVESLIRQGRRIIGAATTQGPVYSKLLFLAEGDAGHLISREGLDRSSDRRDDPRFLYCLQQVVDLPPGVIEECFRVGAQQGIAYDFLLLNPAHSHLNARGQLYSNCQGLTLSITLPAEHLSRGYAGKPRDLLDWFLDMPVLRPWLRDGQRGAWTATLLRTGGLRDIPYLIEDGLAVGGGAAGLGIDFPVLNLTGPATATGMLLSRAAARIRTEGGSFTREELLQYYLTPLQQTHYWRDREFLNRWPGHLRRTHVLFERGLDLFLGSAANWSRSRRWLPRKLLGWIGVLARVSWLGWDELRGELTDLMRTLRFREVTPRPALARVLLDGALNAFRDLVRRPRPHLPAHGTLRIYFHSADEEGRASAVPALFRRWFERFRPVLASAGHELCSNDDTTLAAKWTRTLELLVRQVNLFDLVAGVGLMFAIALLSATLALGRAFFRRLWRRRVEQEPGSVREDRPARATLPSFPPPIRSKSAGEPLIHVLWRSTQPIQQAAAIQDLPHVCPTGVFEVEGEPPETTRLVVHAERCIYCEACWRTNSLVDWGRYGSPPLFPPLLSPLVTRLLQAEEHTEPIQPIAPRRFDPWNCHETDRSTLPGTEASSPARPQRQQGSLRADREQDSVHSELSSLLDQLEDKLHQFDRVLAHGKATVDRSYNDYLEMLARYGQQLALRVVEILHGNTFSPSSTDSLASAEHHRQRVQELAAALAAYTGERTRRTWEGRFAWAVAEGRLLRQHHLPGLRNLLDLKSSPKKVAPPEIAVPTHWLPTHLVSQELTAWGKHLLAGIAARRHLLEMLEQSGQPTRDTAQVDLIAALLAEAREEVIVRTEEWNQLGLGKLSSLPPDNRESAREVYDRHGSRLLVDAEALRGALDAPGDWETLAQRRVLLAECEEIREAERRLLALAADWRAAPPKPGAADDLAAGFARQAVHVRAGKLLVLSTFAALEAGADGELSIVLLRVWLDFAASLLDEFTIRVRERLRPAVRPRERPLVEPGSGPPLRTEAEYLAAADSYLPGDFLLTPVDLLQPRLVPEMSLTIQAAHTEHATDVPLKQAEKSISPDRSMPVASLDLPGLLAEIKSQSRSVPCSAEGVYLAEALIVEMMGRSRHAPPRDLCLEMACMRLVLANLREDGGALRERCVILQALAEVVVPRWLRGGVDARVRHLERNVLELEAVKADFRQRLTAVWQVFGPALGRNANVQASCFALAEAAAWLKAADSILGRMAWLSRMNQAEEREEPSAQQELGRRALRHCDAIIRDRLFRFDEDLASLRRGYYVPHVRAADLLLRSLE